MPRYDGYDGLIADCVLVAIPAFGYGGGIVRIRERQMDKTVVVDGPLPTCVAALKATLHEIEHSILLEEEGFPIVKNSKVDFKSISDRASENWYINCAEAMKLGLIHDVIEAAPLGQSCMTESGKNSDAEKISVPYRTLFFHLFK